MKRKSQINAVMITVVLILFFGILTGGRIIAYKSGGAGITDDMSIGQAKDSYISYNVTHPVVAYPERYYSGDSDRVSKMAYITYDENRQVFLKIVVSDRHTHDLDQLLHDTNMSEELKKSWGDQLDAKLLPVPVTGTFTLVEDADAVKAIMDALNSSDFQGTEEIRTLALAQSDWYVLEDRYIQGIPVTNLWICMVVIGLNILFLLIAVIALLRKGPDQNALFENLGSASEQLMKRQLSWLEPWCAKTGARRMRMAYLVLAAAAVILIVIGVIAGYDVMHILTCHLAIGLGMAECFSIPLLLGTRLASDPYYHVQNYGKSFTKLYPARQEREAIAQDLLKADDSWIVRELGKDNSICAILGEHCWMVLAGTTKNIIVVDANRIGKMYAETVTGEVRSGKVHYHYTNYVVSIHYQGDEEKKRANEQITFDTKDASDHLMSLARKRLGDRAQDVMRR